MQASLLNGLLTTSQCSWCAGGCMAVSRANCARACDQCEHPSLSSIARQAQKPLTWSGTRTRTRPSKAMAILSHAENMLLCLVRRQQTPALARLLRARAHRAHLPTHRNCRRRCRTARRSRAGAIGRHSPQRAPTTVAVTAQALCTVPRRLAPADKGVTAEHGLHRARVALIRSPLPLRDLV